MDPNALAKELDRVAGMLRSDAAIGPFIDPSLSCPRPYRGSGPIRLVILGQDPTVKNSWSRQSIRVVLNLDRPNGSLSKYLGQVASELGTSVQHGVYGTNLVKNFFTAPPTTLPRQVLSSAASAWLPLLTRELAELPELPILTLGEPVLDLITCGSAPQRVRDYWGFQGYGMPACPDHYRTLPPDENLLGRLVFPLPHQPSLRKPFYREGLFIRMSITDSGGLTSR
jgi:hypothetical protein